MKKFEELGNLIGYHFQDERLLEEALTHPSLSKKNQSQKNYQRLEFLGDKVLSLVITEFLMNTYPSESEGALSKRHAALVSGDTIALIAIKINLEKFLKVSDGEAKLGGKTNKRNLENATEALIGAIYSDSNYQACKNFIMKFWQDALQKNLLPPQDPVSELQEMVQNQSRQLPQYHVIKVGGSDHSPIFTAQLKISHLGLEFSAAGKSKKEAQKEVANLALQQLKK